VGIKGDLTCIPFLIIIILSGIMGINESSLEVNSRNSLEIWVRKSEKSAMYETMFGLSVLILFSLLMYQKAADNLLWLLLGVLGLTCYVGIYTYGGAIRRARIINSTIKALRIDENSVSIRTFSYSIFGVKKAPEKKVTISRDVLAIKKCDYPIIDRRTIMGKAFCISDGDKQSYYILPQFFPGGIRDYFT